MFGLGLVPRPAAVFVFSMPFEDSRTIPEADGFEGIEVHVGC